LLTRLRQPASATELADELSLGRQRVNYHLRALEAAGLLSLVEERQKRGCIERILLARAGAFVVDPGDYEVLVARSAENVVLTAPLTVVGPAPSPRACVGHRVLAVDFDDYSAATIVDATRTTGDAVTPAEPGSATLLFRSADLSGAVRVEAEVAADNEDPGERLEFWTDEGLLAEIPVPVTGGRYEWTTVSAALAAPVAGVHDLRVVLHGTFRLTGFRFSATG
jgi:beta-glucosidase